MSNEEIEKLSNQYAEARCPLKKYFNGVHVESDIRKNDITQINEIATDILLWLSQNYCIVPKDKVIKEYNYYKDSWNETELTETTMESFEDLFGKELFK